MVSDTEKMRDEMALYSIAYVYELQTENERLRAALNAVSVPYDIKTAKVKIERLTAALQHIAYAYDLPNAGEECAEIARRALEANK